MRTNITRDSSGIQLLVSQYLGMTMNILVKGLVETDLFVFNDKKHSCVQYSL